MLFDRPLKVHQEPVDFVGFWDTVHFARQFKIEFERIETAFIMQSVSPAQLMGRSVIILIVPVMVLSVISVLAIILVLVLAFIVLNPVQISRFIIQNEIPIKTLFFKI
ncbi:MAG: hypothetical protein GY821_00090 [Gammaproteobacteria bacterium]|nr:hypothetical protein [Gammaproteobacteria bacterium]